MHEDHIKYPKKNCLKLFRFFLPPFTYSFYGWCLPQFLTGGGRAVRPPFPRIPFSHEIIVLHCSLLLVINLVGVFCTWWVFFVYPVSIVVYPVTIFVSYDTCRVFLCGACHGFTARRARGRKLSLSSTPGSECIFLAHEKNLWMFRYEATFRKPQLGRQRNKTYVYKNPGFIIFCLLLSPQQSPCFRQESCDLLERLNI